MMIELLDVQIQVVLLPPFVFYAEMGQPSIPTKSISLFLNVLLKLI